MKDIELECLPNWRFTQMPAGVKGPRISGWQKKPFTLAQVSQHNNIGVLLGKLSGGVVAVDFDGLSAWRFFIETFDIDPPTDTITWSSGRPGRCQMAFSVPQEYWEYVKTVKRELDPIPNTDKFEGFELRWDGAQSVLPPSLHPDTAKRYYWINNPSKTDLKPLPDVILAWWLGECHPQPKTAQNAVKPFLDDLKSDDHIQMVIDTLIELQKVMPRPSHHYWIRLSWAVFREIGVDVGAVVMQSLWPEEKPGEYGSLIRSARPVSNPATFGSVKQWLKDRVGVDRYREIINEINIKNNVIVINEEDNTVRVGRAAFQNIRKDEYKLRKMIENG